jgi:hypothetical protein
MTDSREVTRVHIRRVQELLHNAVHEILKRSREHDWSKFSPEEYEPLNEIQKLVETEGQAPFGSYEYNRRRDLLKPMLEHHYMYNSHHPEHYGELGVDGMNLFDVLEMFFDWKAASERGQESSMNITAVCKRFNISPQLENIFRNTCQTYSWKED